MLNSRRDELLKKSSRVTLRLGVLDDRHVHSPTLENYTHCVALHDSLVNSGCIWHRVDARRSRRFDDYLDQLLIFDRLAEMGTSVGVFPSCPRQVPGSRNVCAVVRPERDRGTYKRILRYPNGVE